MAIQRSREENEVEESSDEPQAAHSSSGHGEVLTAAMLWISRWARWWSLAEWRSECSGYIDIDDLAVNHLLWRLTINRCLFLLLHAFCFLEIYLFLLLLLLPAVRPGGLTRLQPVAIVGGCVMPADYSGVTSSNPICRNDKWDVSVERLSNNNNSAQVENK